MIKHFAICGAPTAGKSEVQKILRAEFDIHPIDDSRDLRDAAKVLYNLTEEDVTTQAGKARLIQVGEREMTIRQVMGELGDYLEEMDPLHFPKMARKKAEETMGDTRVSYASIRKGQAAVFKDSKSLVLEVIRPGVKPVNPFDFYDRSLSDVLIFNDFDDQDPEGSKKRLVMEVRSKVGPLLEAELEKERSILT